MSRWYFWMVLSVLWALTALMNGLAHRPAGSVALNAFAAVLFAAMGVLSYILEPRGPNGKRFMRYASVAAIFLTIVTIIIAAVI